MKMTNVLTESGTDQIYLDMATLYSKFSKCQYLNVGCIITNEHGRIISTGVNGTSSGTVNCCEKTFETRDDHKDWTEKYEIHAEMNAILELARNSISFNKISIYSNVSPCWNCLKHLVGLSQTGKCTIEKIVFSNRYHRLSDQDIFDMMDYCEHRNIKLVEYK